MKLSTKLPTEIISSVSESGHCHHHIKVKSLSKKDEKQSKNHSHKEEHDNKKTDSLFSSFVQVFSEKKPDVRKLNEDNASKKSLDENEDSHKKKVAVEEHESILNTKYSHRDEKGVISKNTKAIDSHYSFHEALLGHKNKIMSDRVQAHLASDKNNIKNQSKFNPSPNINIKNLENKPRMKNFSSIKQEKSRLKRSLLNLPAKFARKENSIHSVVIENNKSTMQEYSEHDKKIFYIEKQKKFIEQGNSKKQIKDIKNDTELDFTRLKNESVPIENKTISEIKSPKSVHAIASVIADMLKQDQSNIVIHLHPNNLGSVRILVHKTISNNNISIIAQQNDGYEKINDQFQKINNELSSHVSNITLSIQMESNANLRDDICMAIKNERKFKKEVQNKDPKNDSKNSDR